LRLFEREEVEKGDGELELVFRENNPGHVVFVH
jgi:hypothetical protein